MKLFNALSRARKLIGYSLKMRLTLLIGTTIVPGFIANNFFLNYYVANSLKEDARERLLLTSRLIADKVNYWQKNSELILKNLSLDPEIRSMNVVQQEQALIRTAQVYSDFNLRIFTVDGKLFASSQKVSNKSTINVSDRLWFQQALKGQPTYQVLISRVNNKSSLCMGFPLKNLADNNTVGVVVGCTVLSNVDKQLNLDHLVNKEQVFILSPEGILLDPVYDINKLIDLNTLSQQFPSATNFLNFPPGIQTLADRNNELWYSSLLDLNNGWRLIIQEKESKILEPLLNFQHFFNQLLFFTLVFVWVFTWFLAKKITVPIKKLTMAAQLVAQGSFKQKVIVDRPDELGVLAKSFNYMANHLEQLIDTEVKLESVQKQLEVGRQIQKDFLPEELPEIQGWEIANLFQPAYEVAGDFYDVFYINDRRYICSIVGDVCDKGLGAALFMSLFRSLLRATTLQAQECPLTALQNAVETTNNYVAVNHARTNMFATVFFGILNIETGELNYINAGHEAPILRRKSGEKEFLKATGSAIGIFANFPYKIAKTQLNTGDILVSFSDGVTDARSPEGEFFKQDRLLKNIDKSHLSVYALMRDLESQLKTHIDTAKQFDDITLLAIGRL
jgi:sigma-B regulation protein RsbU (phosphoserine phosphatase)